MSDEPVQNDAFSPDNIGAVQLIIQMRIYDVLMALLQEANPNLADNLLEMHLDGNIIGTAPFFNGTFLTNTLNEEPLMDE